MIGVASIAACGARTGLDVPTVHRSTSSSGGRGGSGGVAPGSGGSGGVSMGGSSEGGGGGIPDAGPDVLPPNDAQPDVVHISDCVEAGITYIYVITAQNTLLHYTPPSTFVPIGTLDCPSTSSPFSMGVDRQGTAYVVFQDGNLFKVSGANAHCEATSFVPNQDGFSKFGMAFSTDNSGTGGGGGGNPGETLYVAESTTSIRRRASRGSTRRRSSSTSSRRSRRSSAKRWSSPAPATAGSSRSAWRIPPGSHVAEIDKTTGALLSDNVLNVGVSNSSFAFAFWGGDFYLFTDNGMGGPTVVTQYNPNDGSLAQVASLGMNVVGVGVSTCAPQ